jgi:hypothetical protein
MLAGRSCSEWIPRTTGQLHHEAGADRLILLDANGPVVIFNDAADDRQTESRPTFLGGEIGQEKFSFSSRVTPWPVSATVFRLASRLATSAK